MAQYSVRAGSTGRRYIDDPRVQEAVQLGRLKLAQDQLGFQKVSQQKQDDLALMRLAQQQQQFGEGNQMRLALTAFGAQQDQAQQQLARQFADEQGLTKRRARSKELSQAHNWRKELRETALREEAAERARVRTLAREKRGQAADVRRLSELGDPAELELRAKAADLFGSMAGFDGSSLMGGQFRQAADVGRAREEMDLARKEAQTKRGERARKSEQEQEFLELMGGVPGEVARAKGKFKQEADIRKERVAALRREGAGAPKDLEKRRRLELDQVEGRVLGKGAIAKAIRNSPDPDEQVGMGELKQDVVYGFRRAQDASAARMLYHSIQSIEPEFFGDPVREAEFRDFVDEEYGNWTQEHGGGGPLDRRTAPLPPEDDRGNPVLPPPTPPGAAPADPTGDRQYEIQRAAQRRADEEFRAYQRAGARGYREQLEQQYPGSQVMSADPRRLGALSGAQMGTGADVRLDPDLYGDRVMSAAARAVSEGFPITPEAVAGTAAQFRGMGATGPIPAGLEALAGALPEGGVSVGGKTLAEIPWAAVRGLEQSEPWMRALLRATDIHSDPSFVDYKPRTDEQIRQDAMAAAGRPVPGRARGIPAGQVEGMAPITPQRAPAPLQPQFSALVAGQRPGPASDTTLSRAVHRMKQMPRAVAESLQRENAYPGASNAFDFLAKQGIKGSQAQFWMDKLAGLLGSGAGPSRGDVLTKPGAFSGDMLFDPGGTKKKETKKERRDRLDAERKLEEFLQRASMFSLGGGTRR